MLIKIVSGGQTGADIAGLKAAKACGLQTGGWMPKGFRTKAGAKPEYAKIYNLLETDSWDYRKRTELNVQNSDGTIRVAANFESAGEKLTLSFLRKHHKPHFDVDVTKEISAETVTDWISQNDIKVLNVAGNSESTAPGIEEYAFELFCKIFKSLNPRRQPENP